MTPKFHESIKWNPHNKVVQDHRDGTIHHKETNEKRKLLGLPIPWTPELGNKEVHEPPIFDSRSCEDCHSNYKVIKITIDVFPDTDKTDCVSTIYVCRKCLDVDISEWIRETSDRIRADQ